MGAGQSRVSGPSLNHAKSGRRLGRTRRRPGPFGRPRASETRMPLPPSSAELQRLSTAWASMRGNITSLAGPLPGSGQVSVWELDELRRTVIHQAAERREVECAMAGHGITSPAAKPVGVRCPSDEIKSVARQVFRGRQQSLMLSLLDSECGEQVPHQITFFPSVPRTESKWRVCSSR